MILRTALLLCCITTSLPAQQLALPKDWAKDSAALAASAPVLARRALAQFRADDRDADLNTRFRLQFVAGDYAGGMQSLTELRRLRAANDSVYAPTEYTQYEIAARSAMRGISIATAFDTIFGALSDRLAFRASGSLQFDLPRSTADLERLVAPVREADSIALPDAVQLLRQYYVHTAYSALLPSVTERLAADHERRYATDDSLLVQTKDGATVSVIVVRPRAGPARMPALLSFTIYADGNNLYLAQQMAANGYVGVVATSRGKRYSPGPVIPFEHDGSDANDVIDWISRQPWSDGQVGMMGGSYAGWTQWAAAMYHHPALKTIVPSAAVVPGYDTPLENGIYQGFQYPWVQYTTNTPYLDEASYGDRDRWGRLDSTYYASGVAYRSLDSIDGTPNPIWQRWISHPTYDAFWQRLAPQGKQFARINIPVLTTTGYFDGAQLGAFRYLREHTGNNPRAPHYLLIGPWEHFGSQGRPSPVISGYRIDPVARTDITGVIYQWFDYILKKRPKPAILVDRVNYQVMGANRWGHARSLQEIARDTLTFYLRRATSEPGARTLSREPGSASESVPLTVDLRDRRHSTSNYIPGRLADSTLNLTNAVVFVSEPLAAPVTVAGAFSGVLDFITNKRDIDVGVTLYEAREDGTWFHLSYYLGRLSLARDPSRRQLLVRGAPESIPFRNTRMISKVIEQGSRLVVLLNVNQAADTPVNYGSGKDVYAETIADAGAPMQIEWRATSVVRVPVVR